MVFILKLQEGKPTKVETDELRRQSRHWSPQWTITCEVAGDRKGEEI
jgi:hypothetical protein